MSGDRRSTRHRRWMRFHSPWKPCPLPVPGRIRSISPKSFSAYCIPSFAYFCCINQFILVGSFSEFLTGTRLEHIFNLNINIMSWVLMFPGPFDDTGSEATWPNSSPWVTGPSSLLWTNPSSLSLKIWITCTSSSGLPTTTAPEMDPSLHPRTGVACDGVSPSPASDRLATVLGMTANK